VQAPGIGRVQAALLTALGVLKISDIVPHRGTLACLFSQSTVNFYISIALGLGSTQIGESEQRKSLSTETTFSSSPLNTADTLHPDMLVLVEEQSNELAEGLAKEGLKGETISIKVKLETFVVIQRSKTLDHGVCSKDEILLHSTALLEHLISQHKGKTLNIRLLGIKVHNFVSEVSEVDKQSSILSFVNRGEKEEGEWQCPVCVGYFPKKLNSFNKHVDKCTGEGNTEGDLSQQSTSSEVPEANIAKTERWICPICDKSLAPQLVSFNKHVDKCLSEGSVISVSELSKKQSGVTLPHKFRGDISPDLIETSVQPKFSMITKEASSLVEVKDERWSCPICSESLPPQLLSFNKHVDICLGLTSSVQAIPSPQNNQQNQKKRKHNGTDNQNSLKKFFKSK